LSARLTGKISGVRVRLATLAAALPLLAACGTPSTAPNVSAQPSLIVFAASSLTEPFNDVAAGFGPQNGGARVTYNFDGSPQLRSQLEYGAKADVFASANMAEMDRAKSAGLLAEDPKTFAANKLAIITPKANPGGVFEPKDLAKPRIKVAAAAAEVPVGAYFRMFLDKASADSAFGSAFRQQVLRNVISEDTNVKQVVAKVQLGEADAGVVYTSDVSPSASSDVNVIAIPDRLNAVAEYPIAVLKGAAQTALAGKFVDYVLSAEGQRTLDKYHFISVK
jgi:molybdate transport system substrate-binding protein